ncbi:MAG: hypothetical protein LBQ00_02760 [Syntrophobacterales bacterium]|nr:hypothetical protein [Syntrophobacterales bacterium]
MNAETTNFKRDKPIRKTFLVGKLACGDRDWPSGYDIPVLLHSYDESCM